MQPINNQGIEHDELILANGLVAYNRKKDEHDQEIGWVDIKPHSCIAEKIPPRIIDGKPVDTQLYILTSVTETNKHKSQYHDKAILDEKDTTIHANDPTKQRGSFLNLDQPIYVHSNNLEIVKRARLTNSGIIKIANIREKIESMLADKNHPYSKSIKPNYENAITNHKRKEINDCLADGGKFVPRSYGGDTTKRRPHRCYNICAILDRYDVGIPTGQGRYYDESHIDEIKDIIKNAKIGTEAHEVYGKKELYGYENNPAWSISINAFYEELNLPIPKVPQKQGSKNHNNQYYNQKAFQHQNAKDATLEEPTRDHGDMGE